MFCSIHVCLCPFCCYCASHVLTHIPGIKFLPKQLNLPPLYHLPARSQGFDATNECQGCEEWGCAVTSVFSFLTRGVYLGFRLISDILKHWGPCRKGGICSHCCGRSRCVKDYRTGTLAALAISSISEMVGVPALLKVVAVCRLVHLQRGSAVPQHCARHVLRICVQPQVSVAII